MGVKLGLAVIAQQVGFQKPIFHFNEGKQWFPSGFLATKRGGGNITSSSDSGFGVDIGIARDKWVLGESLGKQRIR